MPTQAEAIEAADRIIRSTVREAERLVTLDTPSGRATTRKLAQLMRRADRDLAQRLRALDLVYRGTGPDSRFTPAQAAAFRHQAVLTTRYVQARLRGLTEDQAMHHIASGISSSTNVLAALEQRFEGILQPLRVREAAVMDGIVANVRSSSLGAIETSVDRYGRAMVSRIENTLATGLAAGKSRAQMVRELVGMHGPKGPVSMAAHHGPDGLVHRTRVEQIDEGLFVRHEYWARRIVRTETARAYNAAKTETTREMREQFPDLRQKILATFDKRTAYDSVYVHGQVRAPGQDFEDGAGRHYVHPPGRPNDRETIVPWRDGWPDTPNTTPKSPEDVERVRNEQGPKARRMSPPVDTTGGQTRTAQRPPPPRDILGELSAGTIRLRT